jgi:crossover junction endodeoxyribonuclease RusA
MTVLTLPPSANHIWKVGPHGIYKTSAARLWQTESAWELKLTNSAHFDGPVSVFIDLYFPDKRRRDIDGPIKLTLDSLEESGIIKDDKQVAKLHVNKRIDRVKPRLELIVRKQRRTGSRGSSMGVESR